MENKQEELIYLIPPREALEDNGVFLYADPVTKEAQIANGVTDVKYPETGGMLVWREGDQFPSKGMPFHDAVHAIDGVKRLLINTVRFLSSKPLRYFLPLFALIPPPLQRKILRSAVEQFADFGFCSLHRVSSLLNPRFLCDAAREVYRAGMEMAGDDFSMKNFVKTLAHVLEYDDAYRYRIQDMFEVMNKEDLLRDPGKELARVLLIAADRGEGTREKFEIFAKLLPLIFMLKVVRKPVIEFFSKVEFKKMYLDELDWYKCLIWSGYDFRGIEIEKRISARMMVDEAWMHQKNLKTT